ncbi:hypothetical protein GCM10009616_35660 [Microlunatus lacustris]
MGTFIPELLWDGTSWGGIKPPAILTATAEPKAGAVLVQWTDVPSATAYRVGRNGTDTGGAGPWSTEVPAGTFSLTFDKLTNGTPYTFTVQPLPDGKAVTVTATPVGTAPEPEPDPEPQPAVTLTAIADDGKITATWTYTGTAAVTGFTVGRNGTDASGFGAWSTEVGAAVRSHAFDKLVNGQEYTITVQPLPSGVPTTVKRTPSAAPVTETTVTGTTSPGSATINWRAVQDATGYRLSYTVGATTSTPVEVSASTLTRTFANLTNGQPHTFRVKPLPESLNSPEKTLTLTPQAASARRVPMVGRSGLPWNSLIFAGNDAKRTQFENWRRRPVDGAMAFQWKTWDNMGATSGWAPTTRGGDLRVICISPFAEGETMQSLNAGAYDGKIASWAQKIIGAGWNTDRVIIRLGWECNGNWYYWGWDRSSPEQYAAGFKRFVQRSRAAGLTNVRWSWNLNKGPQSYNSGYSWTRGYPGDDVTDVVGLDTYDAWTKQVDEASWRANTVGKNPGLEDVLAFVKQRGKLMAVEEWGICYDQNGQRVGGGDNPWYVRRMFQWLMANKDYIAYEVTYDDEGAPASLRHTLSNGYSPNAAAAYRAPFPNGWGG